MTDRPDPDRDRDEIASAHLDGELTDREAAGLDDDVLARAAAFRAVSDALGAPIEPIEEERKATMLAAALAAAGPHEGETSRAATPIGSGRRSAARRIWLPSPMVAAAAILVVALVGIGLIVQDQRSKPADRSSADLATSAKDTTNFGAAGPSIQADAGAESVAPQAATAGTAVPDLGPYADAKALTATLRTLDVTTLQPPAADTASGAATTGSPAATTTPPFPLPTARTATKDVAAAALDRCDQVIKSTDPSLGDRLAVAAATVGDRPALVYSHPVAGGAGTTAVTRITVADAESCDVLLAVQR